MIWHGLDILIIAFLAYLIDRRFGEFKAIRHPVIIMGDIIKLYEKHLYQANFLRGAMLTLLLVSLATLTGLTITYGLTIMQNQLAFWFGNLLSQIFTIVMFALISSMFFAHRLLHDTVHTLTTHSRPQQALKGLVSRDTVQLSDSDCYKAGIESYAENLSDGVIAPLFYFLLLGLPGVIAYKAINTLDSMIGYRIERYEQFGKFAARLDDVANWIPARITAVLIMLLNKQWAFWRFYQQGQLHDSPNAGHPITAMAFSIRRQLGGDTVYFGQLKKKAHFGRPNDPIELSTEDVLESLKTRTRVDILLISTLLISYFALQAF